jgi:hypothetical protein
VEQISAPMLVRLTRLPRLLVPALTGVLILVALATPVAVATPALVVVVGFVGWLSYLSWPVLGGGGRAARVLVLGLLIAYGVARWQGWSP